MKFQKTGKRAFSILLAAALLAALSVPAFPAGDITGAKSYTITNPYKTVNWDTWGAYKGNLHTHSTASDGRADFDEMIEAHYAAGYDILGMTDHGVVNRGWNIQPQTVPLISFMSYLAPPHPLTDERLAEINAGVGRSGRGMTEVPFGIELNALSMKLTHVNGFFADYGQNILGRENDYETPIAGVDALGGVTFINHPGYWLGSRSHPENASDPKNIDFFTNLFRKYDSCLGIEAVVETDGATLYDRVFWDCLLESTIPYGRNVWGFADGDTHAVKDIGVAFEMFMMPENTFGNVRTAMEDGTFFACSRNARLELGADFKAQGDCPLVTRVTMDETRDQISLEGKDYTEIQWVADGKVIATGSTIDLNAYEDDIGCYVRAQLLGPGGICWTQAFVTNDGTLAPPAEPEVDWFTQRLNDLLFDLMSTRLFVLFELIFRQVA